VKHLIALLIVGSLVLVGCGAAEKAPEQGATTPWSTTEFAPPPPIPAPEYTPVPVAAPAPTPAAAPAPAVVAVPAPTPTPVTTPEVRPAPRAASATRTYVVRRGDTLSEIAQRHRTSVRRIMQLNPEIKQADRIEAGQKLRMP